MNWQERKEIRRAEVARKRKRRREILAGEVKLGDTHPTLYEGPKGDLLPRPARVSGTWMNRENRRRLGHR